MMISNYRPAPIIAIIGAGLLIVEHAGPADEDDLRQRGSDQLCL